MLCQNDNKKRLKNRSPHLFRSLHLIFITLLPKTDNNVINSDNNVITML